MASKIVRAALTMAAIAAPLSAANADAVTAAPAGGADTLYCMRVEAVTGSRLEKVQCWTRAAWADQGVDVDRDWAAEGVRTIG